MALPDPRSLKEPIGWRHSSFAQISALPTSAVRSTSRVRPATPATRRGAARVASSGTGSIGVVAVSAERQEAAGPGAPGLLVDVAGRRHVLDREAERLEERDLVGRAAARDLADQDLADLAPDVIV